MIKFITGFIRKYPHALLLLYWPLYGLVFELLEWFVHPPSYHVMYCALDDYIPFAEIFIIPYYFIIGLSDLSGCMSTRFSKSRRFSASLCIS